MVSTEVTSQVRSFNSAQADLRISVRTHPHFSDVATLTVEGSLDTENATAFHRTVADIMAELVSVRLLVFDLERLKYISSSGIGAFTNILVVAQQHGYRILLYRLSVNVRTVFDTLGFSQFFRLAEDGEDILQYVPRKGA
ncbi:MAG: STAS domain-containing protein [Spirochaetota bacterium]